MKNWKSILALLVIVAVIVFVLIMNKRKMANAAAGGVNDVYYVTVQKAEKKDLSTSFSLTGTIVANNDVNILSETSGRVLKIFFDAGDYKPAGAVLAQVDDELKSAALTSAEANYEKSKKDFERIQNLFQQKSATEAQLDAAKLGYATAESQFIVARRQFEDTKIKTPIAGYITMRNIDVGSMVQGAPQPTLIANMVDISKLKVKLNVSEIYAFAIKKGDAVNITTDVYPGVTFTGRIESISSKSDEAHTFPVEITLANQSAHPLKAGIFARVDFNVSKQANYIVIPREAVVGSVKVPQVFVVENGIVKLRNITVGGEAGTLVQVLNGLNEGETVVVNGQNNLVDNLKVEILNK